MRRKLHASPLRSATTTLSAAVTLALAGCGGGSDGSGGGTTAPGGDRYDAIVGLYDASQPSEDGVLDVGYVEFRRERTFVLYDYLQDGFNAGPNCFDIRGPAPVVPLGGDVYAVGEPGSVEELTITPSPAGIVVRETRTDVVNGFVQSFSVADELPRVTNLSPADFTPCA